MLIIGIKWILTVSLLIFLLGLLGLILNRRDILMIILSLELLLLAININFIIISLWLFDAIGQIFVLFILTVAAAESSIGLAILIAQFRLTGTIQFNSGLTQILPKNYLI